VSPTSEKTRANPSSGTMGEKLPRILPKVATSTSLLGSFTCRKLTTWDRRLYFPSEGRRAEDFFRPKNQTASAGFEPATLGTKGQHATPRPPKSLLIQYSKLKMTNLNYNLKHNYILYTLLWQYMFNNRFQSSVQCGLCPVNMGCFLSYWTDKRPDEVVLE